MKPITEESQLVARVLPVGTEDISVSTVGYDDFHYTKPNLSVRVQSDYTLHYILNGKGTLSVEGRTFSLHENQFFFIRPGERFCYYPDTAEPWDYVWFNFDGNMAERIFLSLTEGRAPTAAAKNPAWVREILVSLFRRIEAGAFDGFAATAFLYLLFSELGIQKETIPTGENIAAKAAALIRLNFQNPEFRISSLAEMLYICPPYLSRVFRRERDMTPEEYLIHERLSYAATLIAESELPIAAIAENCGYRDAIHFTKSFRSHYGLSPREFRAKNKESRE